jgi:hypothetical protein
MLDCERWTLTHSCVMLALELRLADTLAVELGLADTLGLGLADA